MSETAAACVKCGLSFTPENPPVRFLGELWCREDYARELGTPGKIEQAHAPAPRAAKETASEAETSPKSYSWPVLQPEGDEVRGVLSVVGWLMIAAGVIGGITIFAMFGTVEVPTNLGGLYGGIETEEVTNPVAIVTAVGVFFNGLVIGSLCIGASAILENQAKIMRQRN